MSTLDAALAYAARGLPVFKMGLYRQMIGRVLRPAPNKPDAIVIDHSGAVHRHGFVEDRVEWTLSPEKYAENATHTHAHGEHGPRLVECSKCGALRVGGEACRHCGLLRGYKDGWVGHKFRERFGAFPPWEYKELKSATPSEATFRWVKSRAIAYAKSRAVA
jgi:DNA repair protein RadD